VKLKYKFILFFVPLFIIELVTVSLFNIESFEQDKLAYVFSSTMETTNTALALLQNEIMAQRPVLEIFTSSFDFVQNIFPAQTKSFLQANESIAYVETGGQSAGAFKKLDVLGQPIPNFNWPEEKIIFSSTTLMKEAVLEPQIFKDRPDLWGLTYTLPMRGYHYPAYRFRIVFKKNTIQALLDRARSFQLFLIDKNGEIILKPKNFKNTSQLKIIEEQIKSILNNQKKSSNDSNTSSFTREIPGFNKEPLLISVARGTDHPWGFLSVIEKSKTLAAVQKMKRNSLGVFFLLVGVGLILILILVQALVKNIEILKKGLVDFSNGNWNTRTNIKSKDEIGILSNIFNDMTSKIQTLVTENIEKSRMAGELDTARNVQKSMVPSSELKDPNFDLHAHFEPASECGGDWWYYNATESHIVVYIADVTGHGVAPALLTAATRAAVSALQATGMSSLSEFVKNLNRVIFESGSGNLMMTFLMATIDRKTGLVEYVNASHCPPVIFKRTNDKIENIFLDDIGGPRLGEGPHSTYRSSQAQMSPGDLMLTFTDGLTESSNETGRFFGDKKTLKTINRSITERKNPLEVKDDLLQEFQTFKKGVPLDDDLTFFILKYRQPKTAIEALPESEINPQNSSDVSEGRSIVN
jgi:sigma-B regulation protein RsbU (phosphoserine phosphatase)